MKHSRIWIALLAPILGVTGISPQASSKGEGNPNAPTYAQDGKLKFPGNYREWLYLTSGIDMSYGPAADMGHSMFDNVFVNPDAYKAFVATGKWPDKTVFVLEGRVAGSKGSINKAGHYQTTEIMSRSIHLKDDSRGGWAFFGFGDGPTGSHIPKEAVCYSCHADHGAVDTTFVQFYPTLLDIARQKGTLSPGYMKKEAAMADKK